MMVGHYRELIAWQLADQFKIEVIRLVESSPAVSRSYKYRDQLLSAATSVAANLVEGFLRFSPGEFRKFIDYAVASLSEAEIRLKDGIALRYFNEAECELALQLARRCLTASIRLKQSPVRIRPQRRGL